MRVLFVTNIPAPYRVRFFNQLANEVDLTVLYEAESARNIKFSFDNIQPAGYKEIFLKKGNIKEKIPNLKIIPYILKKDYDVLILTNYAYFTELIAYIMARIYKIPYIIEEDGNRIKENEPSLVFKIKKWLISGASVYLSPSKNTDTFLVHYGALRDNIFRYPFSSVKESEILNELPKSKYQDKRTKFLYVGRIIPLKGIDVLIKAFNKALEVNQDIDLTIVGNAPDLNYLSDIRALSNPQIRFLDFMESEELKVIYESADVFLFPTRYDPWGLVVNEAISFGLPVISSNQCMSALELITDGINGYLYDPEDYDALTQYIIKLAGDPSLQAKMAKENLKLSHDKTIEKMVEAHLIAFRRFANNE